MKKLQDRLFLSLCVPCLWMVMLIADMVVFAGRPPVHSWSRAFEGAVFIASFLFYQVRPEASQNAAVGLFFPFLIQFAFWWAFTFFVLWAAGIPRTKVNN